MVRKINAGFSAPIVFRSTGCNKTGRKHSRKPLIQFVRNNCCRSRSTKKYTMNFEPSRIPNSESKGKGYNNKKGDDHENRREKTNRVFNHHTKGRSKVEVYR
ncbi:hypothetical protein M413DRAFT_197632 [Hebeloma cylindrosporum]|uniref:Uncharacterized protein n=1 Tax=Hebeloma cylindrosporum TaxID=76867 RepID=A0A0C2XNU3_HEBCY|nr:hypothetical protein M413DRAFT_197632 [Hebeloma cylindrosporum h7]